MRYTEKDRIKPTLVMEGNRYPNPGIRKIYRFDNDLGASVIRHPCSYGYAHGLWELAVVKYDGPGNLDFCLTYDTPITGDVEGWLTDADVQKLLQRIQGLKTIDVMEIVPTVMESRGC